jgi:hypothetical protein
MFQVWQNFGVDATSQKYTPGGHDGKGQISGHRTENVSRSDGVLEYWSDGPSLVNSMHQIISMASV